MQGLHGALSIAQFRRFTLFFTSESLLSAAQLRVWEVARGADNSATAAAARAEQRVEAPFLDATWKEDGSHVFAVGCDNAVRMWNLQTNTLTQIGAVGYRSDRCQILPPAQGAR
jgi:photosystem II stability/assembly factor-like uncharacterized protein